MQVALIYLKQITYRKWSADNKNLRLVYISLGYETTISLKNKYNSDWLRASENIYSYNIYHREI